MKRRGGGSSGGAPADLLVCFPSRAHLALMPKPIRSPSRPADKRHQARPGTRGQASPLFKTAAKASAATAISVSSDITDEPTSPKVTCAGQIKVRTTKSRATPAGGGDKSWIDTLSLKKDVMHFVGALRGLRFNLRCFGAFHGAVDCTSDDDDDEEEEEEEEEEEDEDKQSATESSAASRTVFSKWLMLLEEETQSRACKRKDEEEEGAEEGDEEETTNHCSVEVAPPTSGPPANALLLMRCRSAPAKGWLKRGGGDDHEGEEAAGGAKMTIKAEDKEEEERLVLMSYAPDFFKISTDIAKETWVVGGVDPLARSRSWRR